MSGEYNARRLVDLAHPIRDIAEVVDALVLDELRVGEGELRDVQLSLLSVGYYR